MFKLVAVLLAISSQGPAPSGVTFEKKTTFETEQACKDYVKTPEFKTEKDALVKFVKAHLPKSEKFGLAYECEKLDDHGVTKANEEKV